MSDAEFNGSIHGRRKSAKGSDAKPVVAAVAEPVKEKEFFDVKLGAVDAKSKIKIIKEIRTLTNLGLKEVQEG
jgi:large subunit ribosomal protein L7/L12